jgi:hemolysin type calcium-binding protein
VNWSRGCNHHGHADDWGGDLWGEDFRITPGNDTMTGGAGDDIMLGLNGRDSLDAGTGDDYLVGGDNKDMLIGGPGNNTVKQGHDTSTTLASKIQARWVDWSNHLRVYGASRPSCRRARGSAASLDLDDSCNDAAFVIRPRAPKK